MDLFDKIIYWLGFGGKKWDVQFQVQLWPLVAFGLITAAIVISHELFVA